MTVKEFRTSTGKTFIGPLRALWHAGRGDWQQAHEIAQSDDSPEAAWIHAHLHRAEGDAANARYWYRVAGRPAQTGDLDAEWSAIAQVLLADRGA